MPACHRCSTVFEVAPEDLHFYDKVSPVFGGVKTPIPPPTHCPDCRQRRRLSHCNERFLYPGSCKLCGKRMMTQFPPHLNQPCYCYTCWHSDRWDPFDYGAAFDFNRPFFEQFNALKRRVPAQGLTIDGTVENCDYIHYAGSSKNCYLIMHADFCEDCYYGYGFKKNIACVDGFYNLHCERCYDCVDVHRCYGLIACQDCAGCSTGAFLRDCIGCKNCFLCVGLRQKEYCFMNRQFSKAEYEAKIAGIDLSSYPVYRQCRQQLTALERQHPFKATFGHNTQNCLGDHLANCKDARFCFDCEEVETAKYCYQLVLGAKDVYDVYQYGTNLQQSYECAITGADSTHILFSQDVHMTSSEVFYSYYLESCKNCFGCASMHHRSYCILNKPYTKEAYEALVPKIIEHMRRTGEWGEFFPVADSFFGYNKTTAQMYYPLERQAALAKGWPWDDYAPPPPDVQKVIPAEKLPDRTADIPDDILNWAIRCEATGRRFKLTAPELRFYRQNSLPVPRRHPDQRHLDRFARRNPRTLWQRTCGKCRQPMMSSFSSDGPEIVYCEACYTKTVY